MSAATVLLRSPPARIAAAGNQSRRPLYPSPSPRLRHSHHRRLLLRLRANRQEHRGGGGGGGVEPEEDREVDGDDDDGGTDLGWLPAFPNVALASMANFLFGYHIGVMNGPIVSIAHELGFEGNSLLEGLVVSIFIASAFIGSLFSGSLVDNLGCRKTFQIVTVPLIIGAFLSAQAHSLNEILLGRFLVGLGIGVNTVLVPVYISEVSPTQYRGSLGSFSQIATCLGIIVSLVLGIPSEDDPHWWRVILYIATIPGFILISGMQFAAESPRWLYRKARRDDAKTIIRKLWGKSKVKIFFEEMQSVLNNNVKQIDASWSELLIMPHRKVAFIGGTLFFLQQFAGINGVLYFSSLTFKGIGVESGALASLCVGLTNLAGSLYALYLMDQQGRKKLLIGSYLGMAVSMFMVTYAVQSSTELSGDIAVIGTVMYIFSFAVGAGPVTGLIIPELSSGRLRSKIMSFSFAIHWVCNFIVGLFFLELVNLLGVGPVYASFGAVSLLSATFAFYYIVETKGRSLEEIELILSSSFTEK